jgi:hypothetical protein
MPAERLVESCQFGGVLGSDFGVHDMGAYRVHPV